MLPWSLSLVVVHKHICPLPKSLSPSVLCCRHLGPYLMFYHLDSSYLIKYVCFYLSNLFTSPPQGTLSFISYCSQWLLYLFGFFPPITDALQLQLTFLLSLGAVVRKHRVVDTGKGCNVCRMQLQCPGELEIWCPLGWELTPSSSLCNLSQLWPLVA